MTCDRKPALRRYFAGVLFAGIVAALAAGPAVAQSSIRVLVNDEPITSLDIKQRARMMSVFTNGKQGEKDAIDQLIDERLMMQEAKRRNIKVEDSEVAEELTNRAKAAKLTGEQFVQAMRQAGINPQTFKDFLRANMAWTRIVRARFRATVKLTDLDVAAAMTSKEAKPDQEAKPEAEKHTATEYRLQPILFLLPSGAPAAAEAKKRGEANAFRSAFKGCDHSLEQAGGSPGIVVKDQVRRDDGSLPAAMKETLAEAEVGTATEPERVAEGLQILGVCAKNVIAGQTEEIVEKRQEITSEKSQLLARRYLRDLRSDAVIEYR